MLLSGLREISLLKTIKRLAKNLPVALWLERLTSMSGTQIFFLKSHALGNNSSLSKLDLFLFCFVFLLLLPTASSDAASNGDVCEHFRKAFVIITNVSREYCWSNAEDLICVIIIARVGGRVGLMAHSLCETRLPAGNHGCCIKTNYPVQDDV